MRLNRLRLLRAPGIRNPFTFEPSEGINLVTGPNGVGKSTICRAVRSLLWPDTVLQEPFEAEAEFELGNERLLVSRRDRDIPKWDGGQRPNLGPDHLADRYLLGVPDLLQPGPGTDPLAREIRKHMAGGFDLGTLRDTLFPTRTGRAENSDLKTARGDVTRLKSEQQSLAMEQDRLEDLIKERDLAGAAQGRQAVLESLRELIRLNAAHNEAASSLEKLPPACAHVRPEDPGKLEILRSQERDYLQKIKDRTAALATIGEELDDLESSGGPSSDLSLGLLRKKLETLVDRGRDVRHARESAGGPHLDQVLADASAKPGLFSVIAMLVVGAALIAAGNLLPLPGPWLRWVFVAFGGGAGGAGIWGLVNYFRGAGQARIALEKKQEIAHKKDRLAGCRTGMDEALAGFNAKLESAGIASVSDADEAAQRLEDLSNRLDRINSLEDARKNNGDFLDRERGDLDRVRGEVKAMLDRLDLDEGPAADAEVSRLLDLLPRFEETVRDRDDSAREIDRLTKRLADGANLLHDGETPAMSTGKLADLIDIEKQRAAELVALIDEINRIQLKIDQTRQGSDLQEALAAAGSAMVALEEVRQANRESDLGKLLLDHVERRHEKESRPRVLAKAEEYFSLFTGGLYGLEMAGQGDGADRFLARAEDTDKPLELDELSDGTRAQLLLAVKLAFMTVGEEGARPPIFLDDSMTSADPERFAAAAASLGRLAAEEGRQIFYLTPNPTDAAAFQRALAEGGLAAARHIDLARVRGAESTVDSSLLDPANLPANVMAPDPAGMSPTEYAAALMVPRPDPWAPRGALHVFYVLSENLDLVRRLVDGNGPTLNRFEKSRDTLVTAAAITDNEATLTAAGGELWNAWLDGWRLGRARPVTSEFLKESAAVSGKFLESVTAALEDCGWDGARLLKAIEAKKVKGFRVNKLGQLRQELEDADLLAHGKPLTDDELLTHTRDRVAPLLATNILDMKKVRTMALTFSRLVQTPDTPTTSPPTS